MAALGSLVVKLALEYAEFTKGIDKNSQESLKFAKKIQSGFDTATGSVNEFFTGIVSGALAAVAAYASVSTVIDGLSSSIDRLAALDDAAQKTGSSVENLSKIQQVAVEFSHDFGLIDSALVKLSKGMATFDSETNYTARALKALGIESRDAAGNLRDPSLILVEIAKNLQNYRDGAAKSALVMDLFGKSGAEALPILNDIADNVDRFGSISADAAGRAALFQDQVGAMRSRADDAFMSFTSGLIPSLLRVTESTHNAGDGMNFFSDAGDTVGKMLEGLLKAGSSAWMIFDQLGDTLGTRASQLQALVKGDFHEIGQLEKNLDMLHAKRLTEHQEYVKRITGGSKEIIETASEVKKQLNYQTGTEGTDTEANAYEALVKKQQSFIDGLEKEASTLGMTYVQQKLYEAGVLGITGAQLQAVRTQAEHIENYKQEQDVLEGMRKSYADAADSYLKFIQATQADIDSATEKVDRLKLELGLMDKTEAARTKALALFDLEIKYEDRLKELRGQNVSDSILQIETEALERAKAREVEVLGIQELVNKNKKAAAETQKVWDNFGFNFQRNVGDQIFGALNGKFDDIGDAWKSMLFRMVADAMAANVSQFIFGKDGVGGLLSSGLKIFSSLAGLAGAGAGAGSAGQASYTGYGGLGAPAAFANGDVFKFADGDVFNTPRLFHFSEGGSTHKGVAGEAGWEAVMPLQRDSSGRLGVAVSGGTGGKSVTVTYAPTIQIDARADRSEVYAIVSKAVKQGNADLVDKLSRQGVI